MAKILATTVSAADQRNAALVVDHVLKVYAPFLPEDLKTTVKDDLVLAAEQGRWDDFNELHEMAQELAAIDQKVTEHCVETLASTRATQGIHKEKRRVLAEIADVERDITKLAEIYPGVSTKRLLDSIRGTGVTQVAHVPSLAHLKEIDSVSLAKATEILQSKIKGLDLGALEQEQKELNTKIGTLRKEIVTEAVAPLKEHVQWLGKVIGERERLLKMGQKAVRLWRAGHRLPLPSHGLHRSVCPCLATHWIKSPCLASHSTA